MTLSRCLNWVLAAIVVWFGYTIYEYNKALHREYRANAELGEIIRQFPKVCPPHN